MWYLQLFELIAFRYLSVISKVIICNMWYKKKILTKLIMNLKLLIYLLKKGLNPAFVKQSLKINATVINAEKKLKVIVFGVLLNFLLLLTLNKVIEAVFLDFYCDFELPKGSKMDCKFQRQIWRKVSMSPRLVYINRRNIDPSASSRSRSGLALIQPYAPH